jgi:hypothetical protein
MSEITELDIIQAYKNLSVNYAQIYILRKLEDIFNTYPQFLSFKNDFWESCKFEKTLEKNAYITVSRYINIDKNIEDKFISDFLTYRFHCGKDNFLYFNNVKLNKENIQEYKEIVLKEIEVNKNILKGF